MKKTKIYYLDPSSSSRALEMKHEENDIQWIYDLLGIDTFDIVDRVIGGKVYSFVVDDEGLFKPNLPVASCKDYNEVLFGKIFICKHDEEGEMISLTDEDIKNIEANITNTRGQIIFIKNKITASNMILNYSLR